MVKKRHLRKSKDSCIQSNLKLEISETEAVSLGNQKVNETYNMGMSVKQFEVYQSVLKCILQYKDKVESSLLRTRKGFMGKKILPMGTFCLF